MVSQSRQPWTEPESYKQRVHTARQPLLKGWLCSSVTHCPGVSVLCKKVCWDPQVTSCYPSMTKQGNVARGRKNADGAIRRHDFSLMQQNWLRVFARQDKVWLKKKSSETVVVCKLSTAWSCWCLWCTTRFNLKPHFIFRLHTLTWQEYVNVYF